MLLNRKDNRQKAQYEKKATHGIQTAKVDQVKIGTDKNGNNYLLVSLNCETGFFTKYYMKPYFGELLPYEVEKDIEDATTIYWETCDKLVDEIYRFIQLFDKTTIDEEGYIIYNFATEYKKFLSELSKSQKITVTDNNYKEFGFVKSKRKVTRTSQKDGHEYTAYIDRVEGGEKNTWYEETGVASYAYAELIGEVIPDYKDVDFWNSFFAFIAEYFGELQKTERLNTEFIVKLIRVESPEYEKDSEGKTLKIDGKRIIKTMFYPVGTPNTLWFKSLTNKGFELKLNKRDLEIIQAYEEQKNIANVNGNEVTNVDDLPF